jgi:1-acyl-sn-glycerol-3-phosphate acyltransferase
MNKKFYRFMCGLMGVFYALVYPSRVEGLENIPAEGGFILCCNHISNRDPFYLALRCQPRYLHFMAKAELFKWKPLARLCTALGGFPVDRGHNDLNAVRTALNLLKEGHVLALFPQGTRSKDNSRTPMLAGVSMIALRSGAPVIPAYIGGPYRPFRKTQLSFGEPVSFEGLGRRVDSDTLKAATERIEEAVWGLKKP